MKNSASTALLLLALLLAGCGPADQEKGLCSYLGGCGELDCEGDDDCTSAAPIPHRGTSHDSPDHSTDHGAPGQNDNQ